MSYNLKKLSLAGFQDFFEHSHNTDVFSVPIERYFNGIDLSVMHPYLLMEFADGYKDKFVLYLNSFDDCVILSRKVTKNMQRIAGIAKCQISFESGVDIVTSDIFEIDVKASIHDKTEDENPYIPTVFSDLQQQLEEQIAKENADIEGLNLALNAQTEKESSDFEKLSHAINAQVKKEADDVADLGDKINQMKREINLEKGGKIGTEDANIVFGSNDIDIQAGEHHLTGDKDGFSIDGTPIAKAGQNGQGINLLEGTNQGTARWSSNPTSISKTEEVLSDGTRAVKFTMTSTGSYGNIYFNGGTFLRTNLKPNTTYTISFDMLTNIGKNDVSIQIFRASSYPAGSPLVNLKTNTDEQWHNYVYTITTSDVIDYTGYLVSFINLAKYEGYVIIKNLKFEMGSVDKPVWTPAIQDLAVGLAGNEISDGDSYVVVRDGDGIAIKYGRMPNDEFLSEIELSSQGSPKSGKIRLTVRDEEDNVASYEFSQGYYCLNGKLFVSKEDYTVEEPFVSEIEFAHGIKEVNFNCSCHSAIIPITATDIHGSGAEIGYIYYRGTMDDWNNVERHGTSNARVFCIDGETKFN